MRFGTLYNGAGRPAPDTTWQPRNSARVALQLTPWSFEPGSVWEDQSGVGNHFFGSTGLVGIFEGRQAVRFSGTDFLTGPKLSGFCDSSGRWYGGLIAYSVQDGTSPVGTGVFAPNAGANAIPAGIVFDGWPDATTDRYNQVLHTAAGGAWSGVAAGSDAKGVWCFFEWGNNASQVRVRTRSVSGSISSGTDTAAAPPWTTDLDMLLGGGVEAGSTLYFDGAIAALAVFKGTPNSDDMTNMRSWAAGFGFTNSGSNLF